MNCSNADCWLAIRRAVDALGPQTLDRFDLAAALRRAVVQATLGLVMDVQCNMQGDVYTLPSDTATPAFGLTMSARYDET